MHPSTQPTNPADPQLALDSQADDAESRITRLQAMLRDRLDHTSDHSGPPVSALYGDVAELDDNPVLPGLRLTAQDACEFGRRWYRELVSLTYLPIHRHFADKTFGRWTATLLYHLGAPVDDLDDLFGTDAPFFESPNQIGRDLSFTQRLSADALAACVKVLSDLVTEFTPYARRELRARVVGEFAGGFAGGLQDRIRDEQTVITNAMVRTRELFPSNVRSFRSAVRDAVTAVISLDRRGRIVEANAAVQSLLGRPLIDLRLHTLADLAVAPRDAADVRQAVTTILDSPHEHAEVTVDFRVLADRKRPPRWVTATIGYTTDTQHGASVLLQDVTLLRSLEHGTAIEPSTGLLTEPAFAREATRILADIATSDDDARDRQVTAAALTIRLGNWAELDTVLPPDMRSRLLRRIHARIQTASDSGRHSMIAGHCGDDVVVLLHDLTDWSDVTYLVKLLSDWLSEPVRVDAHLIRLQPHIGVAEARHGMPLDEVLRQTRVALHYSAHAPEPWIHADTTRSEQDRHTFELLGDLARALDHDALRMDYRPILRASDHGVVGVRPLPYWSGTDGRRHLVSEVLDLAGHTGLISSLLPAIMTLACRDAVTWQHRGHHPAIMIDLPGRVVHDEAVLTTLGSIARTGDLPSEQLQLAVPACAITGRPQALTQLGELSRSGIALALTGYWDDHVPLHALTTLPWRTVALSAAAATALASHASGAALDAVLTGIHALGATALADGHSPIRPLPAGFDLLCPSGTSNTARASQ
jgi:EAL domain-containing protein (putative c-di-GMP-specific phosphodiesterase class I)/PAS domain-containing protein